MVEEKRSGGRREEKKQSRETSLYLNQEDHREKEDTFMFHHRLREEHLDEKEIATKKIN
jgi:hypothetical protein